MGNNSPLEKGKSYLSVILAACIGTFRRLLRLAGIGKKKSAALVQLELDKKLVYSLAKKRIPSLSQFKYLKVFLTKKELWLLRASFLVLILSFSFLLVNFYLDHRQLVPVEGGSYTEGLVGSPDRINPLYAGI